MSTTTKTAKAPAKPAAAKYQVDKLRETCLDQLGIERSTFDGVFYGCRDEDLFTVGEAQAKVDAWLKRPLRLGKKRR